MHAHARTAWLGSGTMLFVALTASAEEPGYTFDPVIRTGDPVPGVPGETIHWLSEAPIFGGGPPRLSPDGRVAFVAGWETEIPAAHVLHRTDLNGVPWLITRSGDAAPGTSTVFDGFPVLAPGAPRTPGGDVLSFDGTITEDAQIDGIWLDRGAGIEKLFTRLETPPGLPASTVWFQWTHTLVASGDVIVFARWSEDGISHINDTGFWRDDGTTFAPITKVGDHAPGTPASVEFGNGTGLGLVPFLSWAHDADGDVAFAAMLRGPGVTSLNDEGVWRERDGELELVVREGGPAPGDDGAFFSGHMGYRTFASSQVSGVFAAPGGRIAFGAHFDVPGVGYPFTGIFTDRTGELLLLVRGRQPEGDGIGGDPAPGFPEGAVFDDFFQSRINDAGDVVVHASVFDGGAGQPFGIWIDRGPGLELLVRGSQSVPDRLGLLFENPTPQLLHEDGTVIFAAVTAAGTGLFRADPDGSLHTIVVPGDVVEVGPGDERTVARFILGPGTTAAQDLVVQLTFTDDSQAIFVASPASVVSVGPETTLPVAPILAPTPFRSGTTLRFSLGALAPVRAEVFDVTGRRVARLLDSTLPAGRHAITWDGTTGDGRPVNAGTYLVRLTRGASTETRKVVRIE